MHNFYNINNKSHQFGNRMQDNGSLPVPSDYTQFVKIPANSTLQLDAARRQILSKHESPWPRFTNTTNEIEENQRCGDFFLQPRPDSGAVETVPYARTRRLPRVTQPLIINAFDERSMQTNNNRNKNAGNHHNINSNINNNNNICNNNSSQNPEEPPRQKTQSFLKLENHRE